MQCCKYALLEQIILMGSQILGFVQIEEQETLSQMYKTQLQLQQLFRAQIWGQICQKLRTVILSRKLFHYFLLTKKYCSWCIS